LTVRPALQARMRGESAHRWLHCCGLESPRAAGPRTSLSDILVRSSVRCGTSPATNRTVRPALEARIKWVYCCGLESPRSTPWACHPQITRFGSLKLTGCRLAHSFGGHVKAPI
jgi:hypothetical protein